MTKAAAATQRATTLGGAGARVCSLALRSVHETKDNLLLICVGLLEALDRLQERLRLPSSLVKELKRKLAKMADRSLAVSPTREKLRHAARVGDALAESDLWDVAQPEEVHGLVHWLVEVTKSVNRLVLAGSLSVCRGIFILVMSLPGVSTACALLGRVFQLVDDTLGLSARDVRDSSPRRGSHVRQKQKLESYMDDPSLTAVVLEYREKECVVPMNINRRIQRVMHFQIPLRSFEATVRLPPEHALPSRRPERSAGSRGDAPAFSSTAVHVSSSSPRSIPVSPIARKRVQLAFSNFSDDVLYQARDRLRQERAATLTGERPLRVPRFNVQDCNEEIYLSCGKHCATKVGPGMHRSVRATVPIPKNRYTYFEMTVSQPKSPFRGIPGRATRNLLETSRNKATAAAGGGGGGEPSVCIGLSTRSMPLNTLVGAAKYSLGFYSVGHVLVGSERRNFVSVNVGFDYEATVGVLVKVVDRAAEHREVRSSAQQAVAEAATTTTTTTTTTGCTTLALVRFSVNGVALRDEMKRVMEFVLPFPPHSELYPTLTLHSQDVQVLSRFSAADITSLNVDDFDLPSSTDIESDATTTSSNNEIWCLDGLRLETPC